MSTLFISDLHLDRNRPEIIDYFVDALTNLEKNISSIYILGDLVEYWVGDDDPGKGLEKAFNAIQKKSTTTRIFLCMETETSLLVINFVKNMVWN